MKKYILTVLILLGLLGTSGLFAQESHQAEERHYRKGWKVEKKEMKIRRKMFRDRGYKAAKKEGKAHKKEYKSHQTKNW